MYKFKHRHSGSKQDNLLQIFKIFFVLLGLHVQGQVNDLSSSNHYEKVISLGSYTTEAFAVDTDFKELLVLGGWILYDPLMKTEADHFNAFIYLYNTQQDQEVLRLYPIEKVSAEFQSYHLLEKLADGTYGQKQHFASSQDFYFYFVSSVRFPSISWTQADYATSIKENSFFIAALQNRLKSGQSQYYKRGYNQIVYYSTQTGEILKAFQIKNALTPTQFQVELSLYESSSAANQIDNYALYYVSTPSSLNYKDADIISGDGENFTQSIIQNDVGLTKSFGINAILTKDGLQYQTYIDGADNDHKADSIVVWNGYIYLGGYFKHSSKNLLCMGLKKFKINLDQSPPIIDESWTLMQSESSVIAEPIYSIDQLYIDHYNNRIIGLSMSRNIYMNKQPNIMLLHIIYTGSEQKKAYTIKFHANTEKDISNIWIPMGIMFDGSSKRMSIVMRTQWRHIHRIHFPLSFQPNDQDISQLDMYDPNGSSAKVTLSNTEITLTSSDLNGFRIYNDRSAGKLYYLNCYGWGTRGHINHAIPIALQNAENYIYIMNTETYKRIKGQESNDDLLIFRSLGSSLGKECKDGNAGSVFEKVQFSKYQPTLVSTSGTSFTIHNYYAKFHLKDELQLSEVNDGAKALSIHQCVDKSNYCAGNESFILNSSYSNTAIDISYDQLPFTIDFDTVFLQYFTLITTSEEQNIKLEKLYQKADDGSIAAYILDDYSISQKNDRDLTFGANYTSALKNETFYMWPRFKACTEFVKTDMCGSLSESDDIWIYPDPLMFNFFINCSAQLYNFDLVQGSTYSMTYETSQTQINIPIAEFFFKQNQKIADVCTQLNWTIQADESCLQPLSSEYKDIIQIKRKEDTVLDADLVIYPQNIESLYINFTAYICSVNVTKAQKLEIELFQRCEKPAYVTPKGQSLDIDVMQGDKQQHYRLNELLKPQFDEDQEGPCQLKWFLSGDTKGNSESPIPESDLFIYEQGETQKIQIQPNTPFPLTTVYLIACYNGTNTSYPINYKVNPKPLDLFEDPVEETVVEIQVKECEIIQPLGKKLKYSFLVDPDKKESIIYNQYFKVSPGTNCDTPQYEVCLDFNCTMQFDEAASDSSIELKDDSVNMLLYKKTKSKTFYIVNTANVIKNDDGSFSYASLSFTFQVDKIENTQQSDVLLKVQLIQISNRGVIDIKFSGKHPKSVLSSKFNGLEFDTQSLKFRVIPNVQRELEENFKPEMVEISTWELQEVNTNELSVQLKINFSDPIQISQGKIQDQLELRFVSLAFRENLEVESQIKKIYIPRQIPPNDAYSQASQYSGQQGSLVMGQFIGGILISQTSNLDASAYFMTIMIRSLQISTHIPLSKVQLQGNVMEFMQILVPLVEFDYLESLLDWQEQSILDFNWNKIQKFTENFPQQSQDLGYESYNSLQLLNTLGVAIFMYIAQLCFYFILILYMLLTLGKFGGEKLKKKFESILFFQQLHTIYIEGYFEIAIASYLTFKQGQFSPDGEILSQILAIFSSTVIFLLFPISFVLILRKEKMFLENDEAFQKVHGNLLKEIRLDQPIQRLFYFLFMVRRSIYLVLVISLDYLPFIFQYCGLLAMSSMTIFYYCLCLPHANRFLRRHEVFNEFMISLTFHALLTSTDWIASPEIQFFYGYYINALIELMIICNFVIILHQTIKSLRMHFIRLKNKCQRKMYQQIVKINVKQNGEDGEKKAPKKRHNFRVKRKQNLNDAGLNRDFMGQHQGQGLGSVNDIDFEINKPGQQDPNISFQDAVFSVQNIIKSNQEKSQENAFNLTEDSRRDQVIDSEPIVRSIGEEINEIESKMERRLNELRNKQPGRVRRIAFLEKYLEMRQFHRDNWQKYDTEFKQIVLARFQRINANLHR